MRIELAYPLLAGEIADTVGTTCPIEKSTVISAITTDSRLVRPGDLFVAICGKTQDGNLFLGDAKRNGASLLLATRCGTDILHVIDTKKALSAIAGYSLQKNRIPVVAITGSVGKTGTKDAVAASLSAGFKVHKTAENQNNELGVAYTILTRKQTDEIMVLEYGTNSMGEIAAHAKTATPDVAIITAIGHAHIGAFGTKEAILAEKSAIYSTMKGGLLILNGDDSYLRSLTPNIPVCYVGEGEGCSLTARKIFFSRYGISYTLHDENESERRIFLRGVGKPRIYASMFAIATATHFGIQKDLAADALFRMPPTAGRQSILEIGGILLINDAYNASPESMREALRLLAALPTAGRRYAVLGDMLELGNMSGDLHRDIGMHAAKSADLLYAFGENAELMADGAWEAGMPKNCIRTFSDAEACLHALKPQLSDGDTVLVKASHALGGTRIVQGLQALERS